MAIELATAYIALVPTTRGIQQQISRDIEGPLGAAGARAGHQAGNGYAQSFERSTSGFGGGAGKVLRGLAIGAGAVSVAALGAGAALGGMGVKGAASLETTTTSFTALLGSTSAATKQIQTLQAYAAKTPFSQQDVLGYAQQFYTLAGSVGMSKDQVVPFLDAVGNLGAVTGASTDNIHNAVMAIGQIGSSGKVTLENLNQISEAFPGFNGAAAIASATGQSTADVLKQISAGTLDAKTGVNALVEGMNKFPGAAGAMAKQSETLSGLWSTFTDTIQISLTQAFQPLIPVIKGTLAEITPVIKDVLGTVAPVISQFTAALAPVIGPLVQTLGVALVSVFKALTPVLPPLGAVLTSLGAAFASLVNAGAPIIDFLGAMLAQLGPPILDALNGLFDALGPVIEQLVASLKPVLPQIASALKGLFRAFAPVIGQLAAALAPVLPIIADAFLAVFQALSPLIPVLAGVFAQVIQALAPVLPQLAGALAQIALALAGLLVALAPVLPPLITLLLNVITGPAINLVLLLADAITAVVNALTAVVGWIAPAIAGFASFLSGLKIGWGSVVGFLKTWGPVALAVLFPFIGIPVVIATHFRQIAGFLKAAFDAALRTATRFVGDVVGAITSIPGKLAGVGGRMLQVGKDLMGSFWRGLKSIASGAKDLASGLIDALKSGINDLLHLPLKVPRIRIGAFGHYATIGGQTLIPRLAQGGLVQGPGLFMLGDNPGGNELALPLDSPRTVRALSAALLDASRYRDAGAGVLSTGDRGGDHFTIYEASDADAVAKAVQRRQRLRGAAA